MAKKPLKLAPKKSGGKSIGAGKPKLGKSTEQDGSVLSSGSPETSEVEELEEASFEVAEDQGLDLDKTEVNLELDSRSTTLSEIDEESKIIETVVEEEADLSLEGLDEGEDLPLGLNEDAEDGEDIDLDSNEDVEDDLSFEEDLASDTEMNTDAEDDSTSAEIEDEELDLDSDSDMVADQEDDLSLDSDSELYSEQHENQNDEGGAQELEGDVRPTTEGKRLCSCQHCGVEYYLLKELVNREALCVQCKKVFVIEFQPQSELDVVDEEELVELGAREIEDDEDALVEEAGTISIDYGSPEEELKDSVEGLDVESEEESQLLENEIASEEDDLELQTEATALSLDEAEEESTEDVSLTDTTTEEAELSLDEAEDEGLTLEPESANTEDEESDFSLDLDDKSEEGELTLEPEDEDENLFDVDDEFKLDLDDDKK